MDTEDSSLSALQKAVAEAQQSSNLVCRLLHNLKLGEPIVSFLAGEFDPLIEEIDGQITDADNDDDDVFFGAEDQPDVLGLMEMYEDEDCEVKEALLERLGELSDLPSLVVDQPALYSLPDAVRDDLEKFFTDLLLPVERAGWEVYDAMIGST